MGKTIAGVLTLHDGQGEAVPAVFDSPHSGLAIPDDFGCRPGVRALYGSGVDNHVEALFADVPRFGAPFLEALFLRSYIDPNRSADEIDEDMLDAPWPGAVDVTMRVRIGSGLILRIGPNGLDFYDRRLTVAQVAHRIETYWRPYNETLAELMDAAHRRFGCVYHVNCHSNRTLGTVHSPDGAGTLRPEMEIGTLDGTTSGPGFVNLVRGTLEDRGYQVVVDGFFKGAGLIRDYSDPPAGRHSLMLEIRKDLYMDEETLEPNAGFARVKADMTHLTGVVCDYAREQAGG